jgi:hypothetical protein
MNGMHQEQHWAYNLGSNDFTASHDFELPPTPTLAQVTLGDFYEFDDKSHAELGFTSCVFVDASGVTRTDTFPDIVRARRDPRIRAKRFGACRFSIARV